MDRNSNGHGSYDSKKELDELRKRYSMEKEEKNSQRDIFSNSKDIYSNSKDISSHKNESSNIPMNSRVPKDNHYKKISNDRFVDISSSSANDNVQKRSNAQQNRISNNQNNADNHQNRTSNQQGQKPLNARSTNPKPTNPRPVSNKNIYNNQPEVNNGPQKQSKLNSAKNFIANNPFKKKFYKNQDKLPDDSNAPRFKGEVYFNSYQPQNQEMFVPAQKPKKKDNKLTISRIVRKPKGRKRTQGERKVFYGYLAIMLALTIIFSSWGMSCLNDVFAFKKSDKNITVTIPKDASTNKMISIFHKNKLIKNSIFCKIFVSVTMDLGNKNENYLHGVYRLSPSMGVEKMLKSCQKVTSAKTVRISFPEGLTINEMAAKLEENNVCTEKEFYVNLQASLYEYGFTKEIKGKKGRFYNLEGYLFPDTYEFFINETPNSVVNKMLKRFDTEWKSKYQALAKQRGMTIDEVVTLASIIQKEAGNVQQMKNISSVFNNRLKEGSGFNSLQSDATADYVNNDIKDKIKSAEYDNYLKKYNTYNCTGLPIGAICNPGTLAIEAALNPNNTKYLYFCHNTKTKEIYLATNLKDHTANKVKAELNKNKK